MLYSTYGRSRNCSIVVKYITYLLTYLHNMRHLYWPRNKLSLNESNQAAVWHTPKSSIATDGVTTVFLSKPKPSQDGDIRDLEIEPSRLAQTSKVMSRDCLEPTHVSRELNHCCLHNCEQSQFLVDTINHKISQPRDVSDWVSAGAR